MGKKNRGSRKSVRAFDENETRNSSVSSRDAYNDGIDQVLRDVDAVLDENLAASDFNLPPCLEGAAAGATPKHRGRKKRGKKHRGRKKIERGPATLGKTLTMAGITDDDRHMTQCDECYDGMWLYDGHNAMMVGFDGPEFEEDQYQEFLDDKECNPSLDVEEEFISLDFPEWSSETLNRLQEDLFKRGDLWMASAIYQRLSCGRAPLRLRVRRLDEELEMKPLMQFKQRGNEMFANQKYQDAIDLYDEAMMTILTDIFVGPYGQIEQIVTVLSNKAECELRQGDYNAAAATATDALVLMGDHEKTRIRRAKAELAIAKKFEDKRRIPYLVQAEMDLYEVLALGDDGTSAGRETAEELNTEVAKEMEYAKYALLETTPEVDFDRLVLLYGSSCK